MDIHNYFNLIKAKNNISSDRQLSKCLGISSASVFAFANKRAIPSDETMIKIADLAGLDKKQALIDVNVWRNTNEEIIKIYNSFKNQND